MAENPGQNANTAGKRLKNDIASRLVSHDYEEYTNAMLAQPSLWAHVPYFVRETRGKFHSMYGTPLTVDFYVWHPDKYPDGLIIEGRYQSKEGTVDEKFPYLVSNMHRAKIPSILVLICPGAKPEALRWCLAQQDGSALRVFTSWEGFIHACNDGLL